MKAHGRGTLFAAIVSVSLLVLIGAAWACTPSAYLYPVSPQTGAAGSEVTVQGGQFSDGRVEIRWNRANGPLLASVNGPEFSTTVRVPEADPGTYYLVAISRDPMDSSRIVARRAEAFEVLGASDARRPASEWSSLTRGESEEATAGAAPVVGLALLGAGGLAALLVIAAVAKPKLSRSRSSRT